jgi:hypothetical protein
MLNFRRWIDLGAVALIAVTVAFGASQAQSGGGEVTVVGTLSDEGVECAAMRGDDGTLYTLTGQGTLGYGAAGTRVSVTGKIAEISMCQQGTTIEVSSVKPAE